MSRFLFVMFEGGGNVPPQLGVARRLVARGHTVRVLGDPTIAEDVRAAGCEHLVFRHAPHHTMRDRGGDQIRDWSARTPIGQLKLVARELMFGPAARYARDVLDEVARAPVDAIAVDFLLYGAAIGAEKSGLPTATMIHFPYPLPAPGLPPFGMGFQLARGPLGRLRDRALTAMMVRTFDRLGRGPIAAARAELGLPGIARVLDQPLRAHRVLVMSPRAFDFAATVPLPANVVHVGAQLDDPAWVAPWTSPWADDVDRPLVLVALGSTFQNQLALTQRVIDGLGRLPVRALVTLGGVHDPARLTATPDIAVVASAPHATLLPRARVAVAHGGHGTVTKALAHGVPLLCIPLGRDQPGNAARAQATGAALTLGPGARAGAIARAVGRLLAEPAFAVAARRVADAMARETAADAAVAELERLTDQPTMSVGYAPCRSWI